MCDVGVHAHECHPRGRLLARTSSIDAAKNEVYVEGFEIKEVDFSVPAATTLRTSRSVASVREGWPDRDRIRAWLIFLLVFDALFFSVYIGAGRIAAASNRIAGYYLEWERGIPLIPWMILPYLSLYSLFLLPLFHLTASEMKRLSVQSVLMILIAGVGFVLFPGQLGYPAGAVTGLFAPLFDLVRTVDSTHNLLPSLHVAFSALIVLACVWHAACRLACFYWLWMTLLAASTVFAHQHHVLDVVCGFALALLVRRIVPLNRLSAPELS